MWKCIDITFMCQVHYYYSPFSRRRYDTDLFDGDDASVDLGDA
jgi:hypothetical protein